MVMRSSHTGRYSFPDCTHVYYHHSYTARFSWSFPVHLPRISILDWLVTDVSRKVTRLVFRPHNISN